MPRRRSSTRITSLPVYELREGHEVRLTSGVHRVTACVRNFTEPFVTIEFADRYSVKMGIDESVQVLNASQLEGSF